MNSGESLRHYQRTLLIRDNIKGIIALKGPIINSKTQLSAAARPDPKRFDTLPERSASAAAHLQVSLPSAQPVLNPSSLPPLLLPANRQGLKEQGPTAGLFGWLSPSLWAGTRTNKSHIHRAGFGVGPQV